MEYTYPSSMLSKGTRVMFAFSLSSSLFLHLYILDTYDSYSLSDNNASFGFICRIISNTMRLYTQNASAKARAIFEGLQLVYTHRWTSLLVLLDAKFLIDYVNKASPTLWFLKAIINDVRVLFFFFCYISQSSNNKALKLTLEEPLDRPISVRLIR